MTSFACRTFASTQRLREILGVAVAVGAVDQLQFLEAKDITVVSLNFHGSFVRCTVRYRIITG